MKYHHITVFAVSMVFFLIYKKADMNNFKKLFAILFLLGNIVSSFAQTEIWYFGNNGANKGFGLDFTGGSPTVIGNGHPKQPATEFYETVTTMCDGSGNIKFYSNGLYIWDATNTKMPGATAKLQGPEGSGPQLASAVQGALTIKIPRSSTKFLLFTTRGIDGPANGLRVNRVNMALPGNGTIGSPLGDVEMRDSLISNSSSEMLTAVGTCDSIWVIGHESNSYNFVKILVTSAGITSVTTQNVATPNQWDTGILGGLGRGSLAFNTQGTKLAMTGEWPIGTHVMDFNITTGNISNPIKIKDPANVTYNGYGTEWSPDGTKLYVSSIATQGIFQHNLNTSTSTWVVNSGDYAELVKGPDNKIYIGRPQANASSYLGVIATPDAATGGASGFTANGLNVGSSVSFAMPQTYVCSSPLVCQNITLTNPAAICPAVNLNLSTLVQAGSPAGTWTIRSGTGGSIVGNTFSSTAGGTFTLRYTATVPADACTPFEEVSLTVNATPVVSMANQTKCSADPAVTFDAGISGGTYVWSGQGTGSSQTTSGSTAGTYTVQVTKDGCVGTGSATLTVNTTPVVSMANQTKCSADPAVTFDAGISGGTYVWSNQGTGTAQTTSGSIAGRYTVQVTKDGCVGTGSATLTVNTTPVISMANQTKCSADPAVTFDAGISGGTYVWSNQGTGTAQTTSGSTVGTYTVQVTKDGCVGTGSATLTVNTTPVISMANQTKCSADPAVTFDAGISGGTYVWSGQGTGTSQTTSGSTAGTYTVQVTKDGCVGTGSATLTVNTTPVVSIPDQDICTGDSTTFDAGNAGATYVWSNQGTGTNQTTKAKTAGTYTVAVTQNGCTASGSATLTLRALPIISMAPQAICAGDSTTFDAGNAGATYVWSNQGTGTSQTTKAKTAGTYTVEVTGVNGCKNTASAVLTFNALPTPTLNDASVCPGGNGFIVLQPSPANYDFYEWSTGVSGANKDTIHYKTPNTTVWVKVTDANGCSDSAFADISMGDTLHVDFGGPKDVCADQSIVLNAAQFGPFTPVTHYTWTPAAPDQSTLTVTSSGTYSVLVEDGRGCQGDATVEVVIRPLPKVDLRDSSTCFTGKEKIALSLPSIYKTVNWSTGSTSINAIVFTPQKVKVMVTNQYDCAAADSANFTDFCEPTVLCFPNVVTPNGDGFNDEFISCYDTLNAINDGNYKSIMNNILHVDFQVYNRWGIRVFQSLNTLPRWDCTYQGNLASPGVYYWVVRYTDSAHNNYEQTGWVQVVTPE
jgi:hypothetical protein